MLGKSDKRPTLLAVALGVVVFAVVLLTALEPAKASTRAPEPPFWSKCDEPKVIDNKTVQQCTGVLVEKFQLAVTSGKTGSLVGWSVVCAKGVKPYSDGPFLAEPGYDRVPAKSISYPRMSSGDVCKYTFTVAGTQKFKFVPFYYDELHFMG